MGQEVERGSFFKRYAKGLVSTIIMSACLWGFPAGLYTGTYRLNKIKVGEYPEMPREQVMEQYNAAFPTIVIESILLGIGVMIIAIIPNMFIQFKVRYGVNIFREWSSYFKKAQ